MGKYKTMKKPPEKQVKNLQYDLFTNFLGNSKSDLSNSIEIWDSIPKYFMTKDLTQKARSENGLASSISWQYLHNDELLTVKIQPALIEVDGKEIAFFPSATEEFVEEALKKILTQQDYGYHNPKELETWVQFTLSMIKKELTATGRSRNITQIKHAIEVMSRSIITVSKDKKIIWQGAILQDLVRVDRDDYIEDKSAKHIARLPLFVSSAINQLEYRQFNYNRLMQCDEQLSRWILRKLINRYVNANSFKNKYHFLYSTIKQSSGLLQQNRDNDNRRKVIQSLEELKEKKAIFSFEYENIMQSRKITDVKYTLCPTVEFSDEQKAANARNRDNRAYALQGGMSKKQF